jgi:hypothetical protein
MSSNFEAPPSRPPRSWPKVVVAFAAGAVLAFVASHVPTILYGTQPSAFSRAPATAIRQPAGPPPDRSKPIAAEPSQAAPDTRQEARVPAIEPRPSQADAASIAATSNTEGKNCTWPYIDQRCAEADTNSGQATQSIRVITADRSAPAAVATTAAPHAPPEPKPPGQVRAAAPSAAAPAARLPSAARATTTDSSGQPRASRREADKASHEANGRVRRKAGSKQARATEPKVTGTDWRETRRAGPWDPQLPRGRSRAFDERSGDGARMYDSADSSPGRTYLLPDGRSVTVYR